MMMIATAKLLLHQLKFQEVSERRDIEYVA